MTDRVPLKLRDYSANSRILYVSILAAILGAGCAVVAWALLEMIALFTNVFYFHHWSFVDHDPWQNGIHWWTALMPVIGGLIVGVIARYLSPAIRGHGMPEAIETIVFGGGKVQPRVAILKPVATAIAIGSGGPFGAEGPVIITGGAFGSVFGQLISMTDSERKVMMVAGASAGMAATFNCPMSATLLAVEILLFEWKPRSLVPVAIACVTAGAVRRLLLGPGSLLQMMPTGEPINHTSMLGALAIGVVAAFFATFLGRAVQFSEDTFHKLPMHWMWWPAIGGVGIGLGGLVFPQALGVGYSVIQRMLYNDAMWKLLIGVLLVKSAIWIFSLGSETAGGILAPLLMIGGALGAAMGHFIPVMTIGAWVVVGMTSVLTGAIGCPLTSAMLAIELTHNGSLMLPVLLSCMASYAVSVLIQPRSLLTENLSRRGLHINRELSVDPLESMLVSQAMHTSVFALPDNATCKDAADWYGKMQQRGPEAWSHWQRIFPLVDGDGRLTGMLTRSQLISAAQHPESSELLQTMGIKNPVPISPFETLRNCAVAMAESNLTAFPVIASDGKLVGIITINDLLKGRSSEVHRESSRTRVLRLRWPFGAGSESIEGAPPPVPVVAAQETDGVAEVPVPSDTPPAEASSEEPIIRG